MTADGVGAIVHSLAPHGPKGLYLVDIATVLLALGAVYARCLYTGSHKHLHFNWVVSIATIAAPVPTWILLLAIPLDPDLGKTVFQDPVVVALAGLFGLMSAFRDLRSVASSARKSQIRGDAPTER